MEKPILLTSSTGWRAGKLLVLALAFLIVETVAAYGAAQFHVTSSGTTGGNGSSDQPWNLQTALNHPSSVQPGDTIWVHGGTYNGTFVARLRGTASQPIVVRNWKNERATIDGGNSDGLPIFIIGGSYTWFWGLEVMSSVTNKISAEGTSWPTDIMYGEGVMIEQGGTGGTGCKFINMIVHDTRQGFSSWKEAVGSEIYGCVVYDNGWLGSDRFHGHNLYIQNVNGTKFFSDNIILRAYSHNIQAYGSSAAYVNNLQFIGNVGVNGGERNFLLGSGNPAISPVWKNNVMYLDGARAGSNLFYMSYPLGYPNGGSQDAVVTGNYFIGGNLTFTSNTNMTFNGNFLYNTTANGEVPSMTGNTVTTTKPGSPAVLVRPNAYDPKRANITVLNWTGSDAVDVDVSAVLRSGDTYEVRDGQNYYGSPVLSGTYTGGSLRFPMTGGTLPAKVGNDPRTITHTLKDLGTFVLIGSGSGVVQPPVSGSISVSPINLPAGGGTVTLTWSSQNATSASIDQGIGSVATNGSRSVQVTASTVFTLTLSGTGGPVTSQATVQVAATVLSAVTLLSPAQGATDLQTNVNLNWNAVPGATGYEVQVGTDTLFTTPVYTNTSVPGTSQLIQGLTAGMKYYWRVRAKNATVPGPYSSAWNFSTAANPQNPFPIHLMGSPPEEASVTINVAKSPGMDSAYVSMWVADVDHRDEGALYVNGMDSLVLFQSPAPLLDVVVQGFTMRMSAAAWRDGTNSLRFTHLLTGGYRVDSIAVSFSSVVQPAVSGSMSVSPTSLPAGGGTVTLSWTSENATAASIDQGIGNVATGGSRSVQVTTSKTFTLTLSGPGGVLTSQVSVQVGALEVLPAVTLLAPVQGVTDLQINVNLNWNAVPGAAGYEVQVATDTLFAAPAYTNTSVIPTNQEIPGLVYGTKYYWRVRAKNATVTGPYSSPWSFTTAPKREDPFPIVLQGYPPEEWNVTVDVAKTPGADSAYISMWVFDADGESEGMLHVNDTDSLILFGSLAASQHDGTVTSITMKMSAAAWKDGTNSLRFEHHATAGYRVDSITVSFMAAPVNSIGGADAPRAYALGQNYPNPFNPSTIIPFDVLNGSHVTLTVYSLLGQKVATLVDDVRPAGSYQVRFDAAALSAGMYFYQLVTGDGYSERRKMLLVK